MDLSPFNSNRHKTKYCFSLLHLSETIVVTIIWTQENSSFNSLVQLKIYSFQMVWLVRRQYRSDRWWLKFLCTMSAIHETFHILWVLALSPSLSQCSAADITLSGILVTAVSSEMKGQLGGTTANDYRSQALFLWAKWSILSQWPWS